MGIESSIIKEESNRRLNKIIPFEVWGIVFISSSLKIGSSTFLNMCSIVTIYAKTITEAKNSS